MYSNTKNIKKSIFFLMHFKFSEEIKSSALMIYKQSIYKMLENADQRIMNLDILLKTKDLDQSN